MKKLIGLALAFAPSMAFAQVLTPLNNINDVTDKFTNILNTSIEIIVALAVLWIIVNIVRYLIAGGDSEKRKQGGLAILWGVVGLFAIISIWGIVSILRNSFVTNDTSSRNIPQIPYVTGVQ